MKIYGLVGNGNRFRLLYSPGQLKPPMIVGYIAFNASLIPSPLAISQ